MFVRTTVLIPLRQARLAQGSPAHTARISQALRAYAADPISLNDMCVDVCGCGVGSWKGGWTSR